MTGIARFVQDKELKKILRETDGLGTEATRAGIIELLFKRGFIVKKGRNIISTEAGRILIQALPTSATLPDMTAHWESQLDGISRKQTSYQQFMQQLLIVLPEMLHQYDFQSLRLLSRITLPVHTRSNSSKGANKTAKRTPYKRGSKAASELQVD